jgi:hexosaminidase
MSTPETLYFDMPYAADGWERGTTWASRATDLYKVFSFMPENLGANAAVMTDINSKTVTVADTVPLAAGRHIAGMQGQLWSETIRSPQIADYMLFPRTLALAERAWHRATGSRIMSRARVICLPTAASTPRRFSRTGTAFRQG